MDGGKRVAIAFSGGMDSSVLLHCAARLRERLAIDLSSVHIHHGLSPNANQWAEHCEKQAEALDINHTTIHVAVERNTEDGLEASARRQRYVAFAHVDVDWIALGHHLDDQEVAEVGQLLLPGRGAKHSSQCQQANE